VKITLNIWRQANAKAEGRLERYQLDGVSEDMSFLETLDLLNEQLTTEDKEPVAFDHDCREGICGMCGVVINGAPHGRSRRQRASCTCGASPTVR
jgi:succinate dehydrogenase / fumarate reductase iron-sulfur subunit